jgi:hypothetical protein
MELLGLQLRIEPKKRNFLEPCATEYFVDRIKTPNHTQWTGNCFYVQRSRAIVSLGGESPLLCVGQYGMSGGSFVCCKKKSTGRSQWPRGLRRRSAAERLLVSWVCIPPGTWMFVLYSVCVVRRRSLRRADPSSKWVLPIVVCAWVWSSEIIKTLDTYCVQVGRRGKDKERRSESTTCPNLAASVVERVTSFFVQ